MSCADSTLALGDREWHLAYRVALRILKSPDQAEDAAQDALLRAHVSRHQFRGDAALDSWLYRIAFNTAVSHLRRPFVRKRTHLDTNDLLNRRSDTVSDTPESRVAAIELADHLGRCMRGMRPLDRVAFTERFLLGTSERELGELLGVSTNAAKQRAFRARRVVRACMRTNGCEKKAKHSQ